MQVNSSPSLVVDAQRLRQAIRDQGFASVKQFAESVGLHRNTVGDYLSGKTVLPGALARIIQRLGLTPGDVISLRPQLRVLPALAVSPLVDDLQSVLPGAAFVLFGSRARGTAKAWSDYDLGVFSTTSPDFSTYSRLLDHVGEWNDRSLSTVQLVDLTRADQAFLQEIAPDLQFLAGSHASWRALLQQSGMQLHG